MEWKEVSYILFLRYDFSMSARIFKAWFTVRLSNLKIFWIASRCGCACVVAEGEGEQGCRP